MISLPRLALFCLLPPLILTPIGHFTFDLPTVHYTKYHLDRTVVNAFALTDNWDDYLIIACCLTALALRLLKKPAPHVWAALLPPFAALAAGIQVHLLKSLFGRYRPKMFFNEELYGFTFFAPLGESNLAAFPSGHTCSILALTTALSILKPRLRLPLFLIGCLIASARVIVAAHYPTDVIAGISLGIWSAYLTQHLLRHRLYATSQPEIIIETQREAA